MLQVSHEECTYIVYGKEVGESNTPHLQGYMEFSKRMSIRAIKKLFDVERIHLEVRKGTQEQAIAYCLKENGEKYERGTKRSIGRPAATKKVANKVKEFLPLIREKGLREFAAHEDASFHLLKHAQLCMSLNESPRDRNIPKEVFWWWGPTGTGKTLRAVKMAEDRGIEYFMKSGSGRFFDGYDGQKFVILDDFRDCQYEFSMLLKLLDVYPLRVEVKGSSRQWKADTVIITAPMPPDECYKNMQMTDKHDKIQQLLRRITNIEHITTFDASLIEAPQPPKGGVKRENEPTDDYSPATYNYLLPVRRFSGLPPLPRSPLVLGDCQSPGPTHPSQTQEWAPPPGCD